MLGNIHILSEENWNGGVMLSKKNQNKKLCCSKYHDKVKYFQFILENMKQYCMYTKHIV